MNNARVSDFANVDNWEQNKLDRTKSSRMGWSDVAISLNGPIVGSLIHHFKDRWYVYVFLVYHWPLLTPLGTISSKKSTERRIRGSMPSLTGFSRLGRHTTRGGIPVRFLTTCRTSLATAWVAGRAMGIADMDLPLAKEAQLQASS